MFSQLTQSIALPKETHLILIIFCFFNSQNFLTRAGSTIKIIILNDDYLYPVFILQKIHLFDYPFRDLARHFKKSEGERGSN